MLPKIIPNNITIRQENTENTVKHSLTTPYINLHIQNKCKIIKLKP